MPRTSAFSRDEMEIPAASFAALKVRAPVERRLIDVLWLTCAAAIAAEARNAAEFVPIVSTEFTSYFLDLKNGHKKKII
jgi:hypothetical protein